MANAPDELSMPHFEDRLWNELEALHHERRARRQAVPTRPPRRTLLVTGAGLVAAAAVVVALVVADVPVSEPGPAAASVVERVLAATEPGESIIHEVRTDDEGRTVEKWYDEVSGAERARTSSGEGEPLLDGGWPDPPAIDAERPGLVPPVSELGQCDPATGMALAADGTMSACDPGEQAPQPVHAYREVDHCRRTYVDSSTPMVAHAGWGYLRMFLETGDLVVDGTEDVDGRALDRVRDRAGTYVFLVDPQTSLPVRMTERTEGGELVSTTTYERLDRTEEHLALLSPVVPDGFREAPAESGRSEIPLVEPDGNLEDRDRSGIAADDPCASHQLGVTEGNVEGPEGD